MANDTFYYDTSNEHKDCIVKFEPCEIAKQIDVKIEMNSCDCPQLIPPCPHHRHHHRHHRKHHKHFNRKIDNCPIPIPLCPLSCDDRDKKCHRHHRKHRRKHHKEINKHCEKSCNDTLLILLFIVLLKYYNSKFWRH